MLNKVKDVLKKSKSLRYSIPTALVVAVSSVGAFAEGETTDYSAATTALTGSLTSLKSEALTILATVVGLAVVIVGGYFLIKMGLKWFKSLSK